MRPPSDCDNSVGKSCEGIAIALLLLRVGEVVLFCIVGTCTHAFYDGNNKPATRHHGALLDPRDLQNKP